MERGKIEFNLKVDTSALQAACEKNALALIELRKAVDELDKCEIRIREVRIKPRKWWQIWCILIIVIFISACNNSAPKIKQPFTLVSANGHGVSYSTSYLKCDSFQMLSTTEAYVWVGKNKMKIVAENLRVYSND